MSHTIRKAIFPVAGLGTRLLPVTKSIPKEMLPIVDRPVIEYAVAEAATAGITHLIFVNSRGKSALEDHFDRHVELEEALMQKGKTAELHRLTDIIPTGVCWSVVRQSEALGLGHAVWCARHLVGNEPFAVLLPDDVIMADTPCLQQMMDRHREVGGNLVAVENVPANQTDRYGILDAGADDERPDGLVEVHGLVEKPRPEYAPSTLSIIGRYILQPNVFDALESSRKGAGGEIQLTDAMAALIDHQPFHGYRFDGVRYDCGDRLGWLKANVAFALRRSDLLDVRIALQEILSQSS